MEGAQLSQGYGATTRRQFTCESPRIVSLQRTHLRIHLGKSICHILGELVSLISNYLGLLAN